MIRELIQTERSYARHLQCLHDAVQRTLGRDTTTKRDATHLVSLSTLLPPLITLSNDLMAHIERSPTAAGVGASFCSVADQLEATFIGWSFTVADNMARLRSMELLRGPVRRSSAPRIGLVFVPPADGPLLEARSERKPLVAPLSSPNQSTTATSDAPSQGDSSAGSSRTKRASKKLLAPVAPPCSPQTSRTLHGPRGPALSPLDIVIMPTQRLPRYLLLLRQLQSHTPRQSVAYARLEHAWGVCRRVADLCDGASTIA